MKMTIISSPREVANTRVFFKDLNVLIQILKNSNWKSWIVNNHMLVQGLEVLELIIHHYFLSVVYR